MSTPRLGSVDDGLDALRTGRALSFPTETVYGLGANALDADAVARVNAIKDRAASKPLAVLVSSIDMARTLTSAWPPEAQLLAQALWPGPLTLILPGAEPIVGIVTAGGNTIGLRMPDHSLTLNLIDRFGSPIVGTSANRAGEPSPTTAQEVIDALPEADLLVIDGGPCREGVASTVLSLLDPASPSILRQGAAPATKIESVLGRSL